MNIFINGFVDIVGDHIKRPMIGLIDIDNNYNSKTICNYGTKKFIINDIDNEFLKFSPKPYKSILYEVSNNKNIPIPGAKISFIKSNTNFIMDICYTNNQGEYLAYIPDGIYDILIESGKYSKKFTNKQIINALNNVFFYEDYDIIKKAIGNTLIPIKSKCKIIRGQIIDNLGYPLPDAEIIISNTNGEVMVYYKTNENGEYRFSLPEGIYDIRIRGPKHPVKIISGIHFFGDVDLIDIISNQSNLFRRGEWLCK